MASTAMVATELLSKTRKSIEALLADVGALLADLTSQEQPPGVGEDEENEQARRVIDVELQRFWQGYYELKRRHDENTLSVAVLALTKSGKSTLLNALLGMEVLPMNNVPETARICSILHDATAREPQLREGPGCPPVRGEADVRSRLQYLNRAARVGGPGRAGGGVLSPRAPIGLVAADSSGAGGSSAASPLLHISAPLVALEGFGPEFGRVTLLDTPGPNEAGEEQLKYQVERLLEGVDCLLYLLDYTKLKTAEEEGLFRRLRAINPQLVARLSSRLFFVINKVDASETSEGLDLDEVRAYVAELVTQQLGGAVAAGAPSASATTTVPAGAGPSPGSDTTFTADSGGGSLPGSPGLNGRQSPGTGSGSGSAGTAAAVAPAAPFRLHPDQVLLLSARNALLARLVLGGRAGPDVMRRFQRLAFGAFGSGTMMGVGMGRAPAGPSAEQIRGAAGTLLEGSGILELEGRVLSFMAAHAGSVKLMATADDTARLLAQVRNVAAACCSCLHRNVTALRSEAEVVAAELAEATAAFEEVRQRTDAVQAEVVAEIRTHLNTLRRRLFTQIVQTLDTDLCAPAPGASHPTASPGPLSRWARVREKFLSMFTATSSTLPLHSASGAAAGDAGAGPSLVPEARSRSREELQALLLDLHDDLMGQIHSDVYDFWGVLEACAASRQSELLSALNGHLAALSRRVEGAVSEVLGVQLAAADIRLRPPSAEQLHSDVQELIEKGIRESTEKHIRVGTRTTRERVMRHPEGLPSLCRWGGYWVEVPRTRTVVETYTATVYSLRPEEIANHFIGLVDGAVAASERALEAYVGTLVERQLAAARERIRDYGDRYMSAMSAALAASSRGAECRGAALAAVEGFLARLDDLVARAAEVQRLAEAAVPDGAAGLMDGVEVYDDEEDGQDEQQPAEPGGSCGEVEEGATGRGGHPAALERGEVADEQREQQQQQEEEEEEEQLFGTVERMVSEVRIRETDKEKQGEEEQESGDLVDLEDFEDMAAETEEAAMQPGQSGGVPEPPVAASEDTSGPDTGAAAEALEAMAEERDEEAEAVSGSASWSSATDPDDMNSMPHQPPKDRLDTPSRLQQQQQALATAAAAGAKPQLGLPSGGSGLAPAPCSNPGSSILGEEEVATLGAFATDVSEPQSLESGAPETKTRPMAALNVALEPQEGQQQLLLLHEHGTALQPAAVVAVPGGGARAASPASSRSSGGVPSYTAAPFDYSRAFLEAMSSSEMAPASAPGLGDHDEVLTMIPLTSEGDCADATAGVSRDSPSRGSRSGGSDTPRSGVSEEWQLVGPAEAEAAEGATGRDK